jgi:hypothetical protein
MSDTSKILLIQGEEWESRIENKAEKYPQVDIGSPKSIPKTVISSLSLFIINGNKD